MVTVISWNVDGWHTIRDAQVEFIDVSGAELALLQEVTPKSVDVLREAGGDHRRFQFVEIASAN